MLARRRLRKGGVERAIEFVRFHVVARVAHRGADRLDVRRSRLVHTGRKIRVDVQVLGLFIGLPAPRYIGRMIVAARLGPGLVNGTLSFLQKRAL